MLISDRFLGFTHRKLSNPLSIFVAEEKCALVDMPDVVYPASDNKPGIVRKELERAVPAVVETPWVDGYIPVRIDAVEVRVAKACEIQL